MHSWNGFLSFGLAFIPVGLTPASSEESAEFRQIHAEDDGRVSLRKVCSVCGKELTPGDVARAYRSENGTPVRLDAADVERLKTPGDKQIRLERFVRTEEIDPKYYEKTYYVEPLNGEKAFGMLHEAMRKESRAGLTKIVMGAREHLAALRADGPAMLLHRLYFPSEIRAVPEVPSVEIEERELQLARIMIGNLASPFHPQDYRDEFQDRLRSAIEQKANSIKKDPGGPFSPPG